MRGGIPRAAGEGALAGWLSGAVLGGWDIFLSRDLPRGMLRLAAGRFLPPALSGALLGILAVTAVELLLRYARGRGRRWLLSAVFLLGTAYLAAVTLAAGPLRGSLFPQRIFSGRLLSVTMFLLIALPPGAALLRRSGAALSGTRNGVAGPGAPGGALRSSWAWFLPALLTALVAMAVPLLFAVPPPGSRSVILLSLDTLRADRVGALGCPRPLTPHLDALAREGMIFEQAESAAPWTLPSHASLFSSLLPYDHGARWEHRPLAPFVATLAEHFREGGYRTASINGGGYVSAYLGFSQGFDLYEEHDEEKEGGPAGIAAAALKWARGAGGAPFFLFVHTYEIHSPYTHPGMADPADRGRLGETFEIPDVLAVQSGKMVLTAGERRYVSGLYDGDVADADRVMGGMLEAMRKEGILDRAVLVVLSDHGEDLWDHDATRSPGHGHSLYEEILHVPLIVRAPGIVPAGSRIRTPVSLLDVAPTLLALAGLPPDADYRGENLERTLRTGEEPAPAEILAESIEYGPDRFSIRKGDLKAVLAPLPDRHNAGVRVDARPLEVFDLAHDPREEHDLSRALPPGADRMVETLWRRVEKVFKPVNGEEGQKIPEELREQLRSLGYVH